MSTAQAPKKRGDFTTRFLSVIFLIPIVVGLVWWKNPRGAEALVFVAMAIALWEYLAITLNNKADQIFGVLLGGALFAAVCWRPIWTFPTFAIIPAASLGWVLTRFGDIKTAATRTAILGFGTLYVAWLMSHLALAKRLPFGAHGEWIFLILTINWFADTGAYLTGRAIGKRKLYPAISPGKSVEGAIGGLVASVGAAVIAKLWYLPVLGWVDVVLIAAPASALGQVGDLAESMLKRAVGVKDSGKLLPGHGGLLDRIDAVLFGAPYVFWYATLKLFS